MKKAHPEVTVVVICQKNVAQIHSCFESVVMAEATDGIDVEIIALDCTSQPSRAQLQAICDKHHVTLVPMTGTICDKMLFAATLAQAVFLFLIDSRTMLQPGCLTQHLATLRETNAQACQGAVNFSNEGFSVAEEVWKRSQFGNIELKQELSVSFLPIKNIMLRREPFLKIHFTSNLPDQKVGAEMIDLHLRYIDNGYDMIYTPKASVVMDVSQHDTLFKALMQIMHGGRFEATLLQRYPSHRIMAMPSPGHILLLLSSVSLVVWTFSSRALLIVLSALFFFAAFSFLLGCALHPNMGSKKSEKSCSSGKGPVIGLRCPARIASGYTWGMTRQWSLLFHDIGQIWGSACLFRPDLILWNLRLTEDQATAQWKEIVLSSWITWLMLIVSMLVAWSML